MYVLLHCKFRPKLLQTFAIKNLMRNAKGFFFNSRAMDYSGRKVDLCHEVLMYQFSYLLYDKIFGSLQTSITPNIRSQSNEGSKGPTAKNAKRSYHTIINKKIFSSIPHDESLLFFPNSPQNWQRCGSRVGQKFSEQKVGARGHLLPKAENRKRRRSRTSKTEAVFAASTPGGCCVAISSSPK